MEKNRKVISFLSYKTYKNIKVKVKSSFRFSCNECKNEIICGYKNSSEIRQQFEISSNKTNDENNIEVITKCKNYKRKYRGGV